jgi:hypothetical protein
MPLGIPERRTPACRQAGREAEVMDLAIPNRIALAPLETKFLTGLAQAMVSGL